MGDDLVASEAFEPSERQVVENAHVLVVPPRRLSDLVRRRIRASTGNAQADQHRVRRSDSVTSLRTLWTLARERPRSTPKLAVFVGVALLALIGSRRAVRSGDFDTWLRDESSREQR